MQPQRRTTESAQGQGLKDTTEFLEGDGDEAEHHGEGNDEGAWRVELPERGDEFADGGAGDHPVGQCDAGADARQPIPYQRAGGDDPAGDRIMRQQGRGVQHCGDGNSGGVGGDGSEGGVDKQQQGG